MIQRKTSFLIYPVKKLNYFFNETGTSSSTAVNQIEKLKVAQLQKKHHSDAHMSISTTHLPHRILYTVTIKSLKTSHLHTMTSS